MARKTRVRNTKRSQRRKNKMSKMRRKKTNKNRQTRKKQRGGSDRAYRSATGERSASAGLYRHDHLVEAKINMDKTKNAIDLLNTGKTITKDECKRVIDELDSKLDAQLKIQGEAGILLQEQRRRGLPQGHIRHSRTGHDALTTSITRTQDAKHGKRNLRYSPGSKPRKDQRQEHAHRNYDLKEQEIMRQQDRGFYD